KLDEEGLKPYPLHLGVTEAGDGEDGRIKSAVGIGTLLEDGLGDTVRVSLTEEPEAEAPVAKILVDRYVHRSDHAPIPEVAESPINPFVYNRRQAREVGNFGGGHHVPRVLADLSEIQISDYKDLKCIGHFYLSEPDKWRMNDQGADYVYTGNRPINFMLPNGMKEIRNYATWLNSSDRVNKLPMFTPDELAKTETLHEEINFVRFSIQQLNASLVALLKNTPKLVAVVYSENQHAMAELRRLFFELVQQGIDVPVAIQRTYSQIPEDN